MPPSTHNPTGYGASAFGIEGEDDHCFHEVISVRECSGRELPEDTPIEDRSWREFVGDVAAAAAEGWQSFEPGDERPAPRPLPSGKGPADRGPQGGRRGPGRGESSDGPPAPM